MTELEHIEIEGFKGLEYVEFEPTDINLITGRNNTGKTSFLEAIYSSFQPEYLKTFDGDAQYIINKECEKAVVRWRQNSKDVEVSFRRPTKENIPHLFAKVISDSINASPYLFLQPEEDREAINKLVTEVRKILQSIISENLSSANIEGLQDDFVVFTKDDEEYPYFSSSSDSQDILSSMRLDIKARFKKTIEDMSENGNLDKDLDEEELLSVFLPDVGPHSLQRFIDSPPHSEYVTAVESNEYMKDVDKRRGEDDSLKIDDISDALKERELVDNLKFFDTDYLVFEREDGEKYQVPYDFMGDGFKAIVGLLWELIDQEIENEIVLIEEPENHMHPGYVAELVHFLIDLARDEDIQFFITTHDHDFIKDFFMDMPEKKLEYLEDEFSLVKMDDFGADVMEYEEAEHHLKDLHLDLRGI
jgi:AAA15 family ATPase/GTPase